MMCLRALSATAAVMLSFGLSSANGSNCHPTSAQAAIGATVRNTQSNDLKNYPVSIAFDFGRHFTGNVSAWSHRDQPLSFWLEHYKNGSGLIWVKIPFIPGGQSRVIWLTVGHRRGCFPR